MSPAGKVALAGTGPRPEDGETGKEKRLQKMHLLVQRARCVSALVLEADIDTRVAVRFHFTVAVSPSQNLLFVSDHAST
jgi:hypothetical protein